MVDASPPGGYGPLGPGLRGEREPDDLRRILTSAGAVVYRWDLGSDAVLWGSNAAEVLGAPNLAAWSRGAELALSIEPGAGDGPAAIVAAASGRDDGSGVPYATTYGLRTRSGAVLAVEDSGRWFADGDGRPAILHGLIRVREAGAGAEPFSKRRDEFLRRIAGDVVEASRGRGALTLLAIAIDNLPQLNEDLGYEAADEAVDAFVLRMRRVARGRDRFLRYGGNRFALAMRGCARDQAPAAVGRLLGLISAEPIETGRGPITVELAVGGATAPDHALDPAGLLRRAEESLALAKRRAGTGLVLYDPKAFRAAARRRAGPSELQCLELLNARRIALACQPVVAAGSRAVAFSEALLRVEGDDGRIQVAADVVPALERSGLIALADTRMLELVTDHLVADPQARLALNVSPLTLDSPDWPATLSAHLAARPGTASRLIVEVTETAAIRDPAATRRTLGAMKALGVSVAIDDFGAGHTSFRHLRDFPVDILKLDGVFVQNLLRSPDDRFFVQTLVELARHLGVETVAEWVEDEETAALLASWGIDYLQGDHCGAPVLVPGRRSAERAVRAA